MPELEPRLDRRDREALFGMIWAIAGVKETSVSRGSLYLEEGRAGNYVLSADVFDKNNVPRERRFVFRPLGEASEGY
ncbi:hypothetical protein [Brevibacterium oceani]|uniref:hypothetical protein n=1 Tax=Brevibacterium oceani TaxID=358099 RepID=UPI0015E7AE52|nr:hypothetical protein [Brevibacterium oceani]